MRSRRLAAVMAALASLVVSLTVSVSGMTANAAAVAAPAPRTGALPRGDLLVPNFGFEDGLAHWSASCAGTASVTDARRVDGTHALALAATAACRAPVVTSALVPASASTRHTAFVQVQAASGAASARIVYVSAARRAIAAGPWAVTSAHGWTTLAPAALAPAAARYARIEIRSTGSINADSVLFTRQFTDLGAPLTQDGYARAAAFAADRTGPKAYVVSDGGRGAAAHLNVIDAVTGRLIRSLALNAGAPSGSWSVTIGATGTVYVASFQPGILWAYHPGAARVLKVTAMRGIEVPFALAPDATGGVYFGGYPDGIVYHYVSGKGVKKFVSAKAITGQNYVRSLAYDTATRTVYVGIGARAAVLACDEASARCTNISQGSFHGQQFAYALTAAPGTLFVQLMPSGRMEALAVTKRANRSYHAIATAVIPQVSYPGASAPVDGLVYYRGAGGALTTYEVATGLIAATGVKAPGALAWGTLRAAGKTSTTLFAAVRTPAGAQIHSYDIATGKASTAPVTDLPGAPVTVQSVGRGPDGSIYAGGYLVGGLAAYQPMRSAVIPVPGVGQPEGMVADSGALYLGIYPNAVIQAYRPGATAPNPATVCRLAAQGQDRPYAMTTGGGEVYIGTMAGYGSLPGALTVYDPKAGTCQVHRNIVPNQSVVSLVYSKGVLYGGSLVWGGLGAAPKQTRARLLRFDTATGRATSIPVPVPAASLEGLIVAPNGNIWMMAQNWLLIYSPSAGRFVSQVRLFPDLSYPSMPPRATGRITAYDASLVRGADGKVYGTLHGRYFFRLDAHDKPPVVLYRGAVQGLTSDRYGNLYFARGGTDLVRYVP